MNLRQAEYELEAMLPQPEYLRHVTIEQEKEGEKDFHNYMELMTRIFESKMRYKILPLEYSLATLTLEKEFYNIDILPMLYKDFISDEAIDYCKTKTKELNEEIDELNKVIEHQKELAQL